MHDNCTTSNLTQKGQSPLWALLHFVWVREVVEAPWPARETGSGGRPGRLGRPLGPRDMRRALLGRLQAQVHRLLGIVAWRGRGWRARPSTRELEFPDFDSRVLVLFEMLCSQQGFFRISTISRAHVNWDRPRPIHVCSGRGGRLPATCGFAESQPFPEHA